MKKRDERRWWQQIGPGIVSGASDNDPTTVATLAVIGSTTVYMLGWLVLLVIPMLGVVQGISGRIGAACGEGLETIVQRHYGRAAAIAVLVAVLVVNQLTLAADLEAGGAALQLFAVLDYRWFAVALAATTATMLLFFNYQSIQRFLVYVPMVFLAYAASAVLAHPNGHDVLVGALLPHIRLDKTFTSAAIALLGTTLTAYAYVWETIEMSEERPTLRQIGLVQADAGFGAIIAGFSFWCVVVATGATLGIHHHVVETVQDAAKALEPLAGRWASLLFGVGLLGSTLIAAPVLAGTTAYVVAEMFGWRHGVDQKFQRARRFYGVVLATLALAVGIAYLGVPPVKLLFAGSIAGGLATPITLLFVLLSANNRLLMGAFRPPRWLMICGWLTFTIVTASAGIYLYQQIISP
jgi:Mn2+/Fe2+ NRAMP family transporter